MTPTRGALPAGAAANQLKVPRGTGTRFSAWLGSSELGRGESGNGGEETVVQRQIEQVLGAAFRANGMDWTGDIPIAVAHFDIDAAAAIEAWPRALAAPGSDIPSGLVFPAEATSCGDRLLFGVDIASSHPAE